MNYFDLVNKCLVELNYKQVNAFSELTKNDHKKIKNRPYGWIFILYKRQDVNHTLYRNNTTSPSFITYSFPSERTKPASFAAL